MRWPLCCLALLAAVNVWAETEYWVSVASASNLEVAEAVQKEAESKLPESFSLQPADTVKGFFYRVIAGPFFNQGSAELLVEAAKGEGYPGAWVVVVERDIEDAYRSYSETPPLEPVADTDDEYSIANEYSTDDEYRTDYEYSTDDEYRTADEYRTDGVLDIPRGMDTSKPKRAVVDEPPPGYKLNKLNRDQTSIDWSSPYLLASVSKSALAAALDAQSMGSDRATSSAVASSDHSNSSSAMPEEGIEVDFQTGDVLKLEQWDHDTADIKVDGKVDESAWGSARAVNLMKVVEPETLVDPLYDTFVRLFYTERGIYISFDMEQPADTLVKRLSSRDAGRLNRDYVSFTLDTSGEGRYAYWMNLALGDTQIDGTALPERQYSINWDGAWYGATTETDNGWSAEYFIPWSQMTMPKTDGVRKIGFYSSRQVAHLNEKWGWPPYPRSQAKFMSILQPLEVTGVDPKQQWSFFPYASTTFDEARDDTDYKAGFDLFWRPSTNLQLTSTVNPDFGTVEADDVVVNLSAFETFFPEKRLFFLEGREIFQETPRASPDGGGTPVTLLNTRRIGARPIRPDIAEDLEFLDQESNQLTELYGAAKVTGQVGRVRYGVLSAFEKDTDLRSVDGQEVTAGGKDYAIARVLYENTTGGMYKAIGGMSTLTAFSDLDAYTNGIDYHFLSGSGQWKVDGQFLHSHLDEVGNGFGGFVDVVYTPRTGLKHVLELSHYEDDLQINALGFLRRNDVTGIRIGSEWVETGLTRIRDFRLEPFLRYEENGEGEAVRSGFGMDAEFKLNNLDQLEVEAKYFPERYDDRNSFGNGTYKIQGRPAFELGYETDSSKKLSYFVNAKWEEDGVDGEFYETSAGASWRPIDRLSLEVSTSYRKREGWLLHQEDRFMTAFDSEEWGPKVQMDFFLSAKQQFKLAFQWVGIKAFEDKFYEIPESSGDLIEIPKPDEETDDFAVSSLNFQARYRWQIAPLSDLFVVYTRFADDELPMDSFSNILEESWQDPLADQLVVKLRYRLGS